MLRCASQTRSPCRVNSKGRAGSPVENPSRRSSSTRNQSTPRSSMHVLQPRVLAIAPIAEVAVNGQDGLCATSISWAGENKPDHIRQSWKGLGVAVAHTQDRLRPKDCTRPKVDHAFGNRHKTEAVGVDIHIVQRWDGKGGLELPRQVSLAVERIDVRPVGPQASDPSST
jgi:hypothetical protein